jgi:hypothetical protein
MYVVHPEFQEALEIRGVKIPLTEEQKRKMYDRQEALKFHDNDLMLENELVNSELNQKKTEFDVVFKGVYEALKMLGKEYEILFNPNFIALLTKTAEVVDGLEKGLADFSPRDAEKILKNSNASVHDKLNQLFAVVGKAKTDLKAIASSGAAPTSKQLVKHSEVFEQLSKKVSKATRTDNVLVTYPPHLIDRLNGHRDTKYGKAAKTLYFEGMAEILNCDTGVLRGIFDSGIQEAKSEYQKKNANTGKRAGSGNAKPGNSKRQATGDGAGSSGAPPAQSPPGTGSGSPVGAPVQGSAGGGSAPRKAMEAWKPGSGKGTVISGTGRIMDFSYLDQYQTADVQSGKGGSGAPPSGAGGGKGKDRAQADPAMTAEIDQYQTADGQSGKGGSGAPPSGAGGGKGKDRAQADPATTAENLSFLETLKRNPKMAPMAQALLDTMRGRGDARGSRGGYRAKDADNESTDDGGDGGADQDDEEYDSCDD